MSFKTRRSRAATNARRARGIGFALLLGLLAVRPAMAFVLDARSINGEARFARWRTGAFPIPFSVNDRPLSLLPNLMSSSTPQAAIEASMRSWAIGNLGLTLDGPISKSSVALDKTNLISFADTAANRDAVGNNWAVTLLWSQTQGDQVRIVETDVVMNPRSKFGTGGAPEVGDVQGILTHELGHVLGLEHSPILSATMFPSGSAGQTSARSLDLDDIAGVRALYQLPGGADFGEIAGKVLGDGNTPVFGAHVVATDVTGVVRVGALSDRDGSFTLPSLPGGDYRVYAEPLDEPVTPNLIGNSYYTNVRRSFRTTFAGAGVTFAPIHVSVGQSVALDPIRVPKEAPRVNLRQCWWSSDQETWHYWPAPMQPGRAMYLLVVGTGLDAVPSSGFSVSGTGVQVDTSSIDRGTCGGAPCAVLTLFMGGGAFPGAHNLYAASDGERVAVTGAVEIPAR